MPIPYDRPASIRFATGHVSPFWFPCFGWPVGAREWKYDHEGEGAWRPVPEAERGPVELSGVPEEIRAYYRERKQQRGPDDDGDNLQTNTLEEKTRTKRQRRAAATPSMFGRPEGRA